jgi:hypothetical protein
MWVPRAAVVPADERPSNRPQATRPGAAFQRSTALRPERSPFEHFAAQGKPFIGRSHSKVRLTQHGIGVRPALTQRSSCQVAKSC